MKNLKQTFSVSTVIISLVALAVGFAGGIFYQKSKVPSFTRNGQFQMTGGDFSDRGTKGNGVNQRIMSRGISGEITNIDDSSITIKTPDGGSKIVMISDSTVVNQATTVDKNNLKVGLSIIISGDQNTDGTVTGEIININSATATPTVSE